MKYEEMSDGAINLEVHYVANDTPRHHAVIMTKDYCNNPSDAWPIIIENKITIDPEGSAWKFDESSADWHYEDGVFNNVQCHNKPLRAAMICFLKMKGAECKN
ncbi:phage protein NinX family protein [Shewanella chilikensis]|uniref:phage protein NinX family protein n=1 Tax=Shewanella chilikensis TaxID=558541 RepID=UPI003A979461